MAIKNFKPTTNASAPNTKYACWYPLLAIERIATCCKNIFPIPLPEKAIPNALPLESPSNQEFISKGIPIADIIEFPTFTAPATK